MERIRDFMIMRYINSHLHYIYIYITYCDDTSQTFNYRVNLYYVPECWSANCCFCYRSTKSQEYIKQLLIPAVILQPFSSRTIKLGQVGHRWLHEEADMTAFVVNIVHYFFQVFREQYFLQKMMKIWLWFLVPFCK